MEQDRSLLSVTKSEVRAIVNGLAQRTLDKLENSNLGLPDQWTLMYDRLNEYPYEFIELPEDFVRYCRVFPLESRAGCSIDVPMWTSEEGASDMVVRLTIWGTEERYRIELDDVLVP